MPNPMLTVRCPWRCEPCGVEERHPESFTHADCWVCGAPMLPGGHEAWPLTSQSAVLVPESWVRVHEGRRTA